MTIERELKKLGEEIKQAESDLARYEGSIDTLKARLSDEFGLESLEDAEGELERLSKEITKHEKNIKTGIDKLKEMYEW